MKRKLELKDLAGYLPYGLKIKEYPNDDLYAAFLMNNNSIRFELDSSIEFIYNATPILRPLSDLSETITHNGKEIIPIVELAKIQSSLTGIEVKWQLYKSELGTYAKNENENYLFHYYFGIGGFDIFDPERCKRFGINNQYQLFDYMHELKIDYRGLIDSKLAISVYDIEDNPYK